MLITASYTLLFFQASSKLISASKVLRNIDVAPGFHAFWGQNSTDLGRRHAYIASNKGGELVICLKRGFKLWHLTIMKRIAQRKRILQCCLKLVRPQIFFWWDSCNDHMLSKAGTLKKAVQNALGHTAGKHFNHIYCAPEKCRLKATEISNYFNNKAFLLKMCFTFKTSHFDIIQMLGNIWFQNALKCKYLKTFLKLKSSQI